MGDDSPSPLRRDQSVEAKGFAKPNLDLSAYIEEAGPNQTVSIALQTGDSIRGSRPSKSIFEEGAMGGGRWRPTNQSRPTMQSKESELSFSNNKSFVA